MFYSPNCSGNWLAAKVISTVDLLARNPKFWLFTFGHILSEYCFGFRELKKVLKKKFVNRLMNNVIWLWTDNTMSTLQYHPVDLTVPCWPDSTLLTWQYPVNLIVPCGPDSTSWTWQYFVDLTVPYEPDRTMFTWQYPMNLTVPCWPDSTRWTWQRPYPVREQYPYRGGFIIFVNLLRVWGSIDMMSDRSPNPN